MDFITNYFAQQGILGIIIIMLIAVVIWQQKRIDGKDKQINELQDKRVSDTNAYTTSFTQTTREVVAAQRDSVNTLNLLQRSVDSLTTALQTLLNNK